MCNSLFFVKALQFAHLFRAIPDVVTAQNKECGAMPLGDDEDDYNRVVLSTPEVVQAVRKEYKLTHCRIRFAFAKTENSYPMRIAAPRLEVYTLEGEPAFEPISLDKLPLELSTAVEVELMYLLLRSRGIEISML